MESKYTMRMGELYCVPTRTGKTEIRDVDGRVVADCDNLEDAALIAEGFSAAVDLIRDMDRVEFRKLIQRVRGGETTSRDADYLENRLNKFVR